MSPCEIELKFDVAPADRRALERLLAERSPECERHRLVATYFDTPSQALRKHGYALRVRNRDRHFVQTIKAESGESAGLFVRQEWERVVPAKHPVLDGDEPLSAAIDRQELAQIGPAFVSDIERTVHLTSFAGAAVEAALDAGSVASEKASQDLCELELELKGGPPRALFDLARMLDGRVPLRIEVRSKAERGYRLLGKSSRSAAKADSLPLSPDMNTGEAFRRIATLCLRQYRIAEAPLLDRITPEGVHQARVALRRLRTAIGLFKPLMAGDDRAALLSQETRRLAGALGELRNLDVLIHHLGRQAPDPLRAARDGAAAHAQAALHSSRPRLLLLDLVEWLTIGAWLEQPKDADLVAAPAAGFAADALTRARKRFRRAARDLSVSNEDDCHRARIAAKKLRYASEFFGSLCTEPRERRRLASWLHALKAVQDDLGILNDVAVGKRILAELGQDCDLATLLPDPATLQAKSDKHCAAIIDAKPFWRDWGGKADAPATPSC